MSEAERNVRVRFAAHSVSGSGGGMERMSNELIRRASATRDVAFSVEACEGLGEVASQSTVVPISLPRRPAFARIWIFWRRATSGRVRSELVHTCGAIARGHADIITVHLVHAAAPVQRGGNSWWRYTNARLARRLGLTFERRMFQPSRCRVLVAVSESVAEDLRRYYPDMSVVVIENGVDTSRYVVTPRDATQPLRAVMVTGDFALKGVTEALDALALVEGVELTVVGSGPIARYQQYAAGLGVEERVHFTGFVDDPRPYYTRADVVLCLSAYESFGLFLVEAALTGCAVLSTDVAIASRLVAGGTGGWILPDREPETVAHALREAHFHRADTTAAGRMASETAQQFSLDDMVRKYVALYRALDVDAPSVLHVGLETLEHRIGGLNRYLTSLDSALLRTGGCSSSHTVAVGPSSTPTVTAVSGATWWHRWRDIRREVSRSSAAVIDVHFPAHIVWALVTRAIRDRPLVVHFQGPWSLESRWTGDARLVAWCKKRLEGYVLRRADAVVVLSRAFRDIVVRDFRVQPRRVTVLAPGVDRPTLVSTETFDQYSRVPVDAPLIVSVRRLVARMGLDVVVWALTEPALHAAHFVVIGTGPQRGELEQLALDLGVDDRVHFLGVVTDGERDAWLARADVSVMPSVALEGYGLSALESLACGTPVVASDIGGLRDLALWTPYVTLVTPTLVGEWSDAIATVLENRPDPVEVAASVAHWTWDDVAHWTVRSVYQPLIRGVLRGQRQVVVLDHSAQCSGGELALLRTLESLGTTGEFSAHVILFESGPLEAECARRSISYEVLTLSERTRHRRKDELSAGWALSLWDSGLFLLRLRRRLHQLRPAVVHSNSLKAFVLGAVVSVMAPWRFVAHVRDLWAPPYLSRGVVRALRGLATLRADLVLANSSVTAASAARDAVVIPSPVDDGLRAIPEPVHLEVLRVGLVGRLAPWKGQDLFLDALDLLDDVHYEAVIVGDALFGESAYRANLTQRVAAMEGRVRMLGHVEDVGAVLRDLDVVVLASRSPEPFGNVITEAMAAGRVVVVPRHGGVVDFVVDRVNGFFYEPNSESSLADVLRAIAGGRVDRGAVGHAARLTADRFSPAVVSEKLRESYRLVLK